MEIIEKKYKITLADGTELASLKLNGNNLISSKAIKESTFNDNCIPVTISDGETTETHPAMELIHLTKMGNEYWFALRDLSEAEMSAVKNRADIEYIALMCDIDL